MSTTMRTDMGIPDTARPRIDVPLSVEAGTGNAISWGAIFGGAVGAAALSLILLILGTGLGLSSVSPWSGQGATAAAIGISTIVWLTATQIAASGMGGYIAGRLRTRWVSTHADEVYFRDTAHGFLAWAAATLFTAAMLSSAIGSIVGGGAKAGAAAIGGTASAAVSTVAAAQGSANGDSAMSYFVDTLFRHAMTVDGTTTSAPTTAAQNAEDSSRISAETARMLVNAVSTGALPPDDRKYLEQLIAQRTGLSLPEAEKRVTDTVARMEAKAREIETIARDTADKARKASSYAALWLFVSLLTGAFVASLAATYGGRQRDAF